MEKELNILAEKTFLHDKLNDKELYSYFLYVIKKYSAKDVVNTQIQDVGMTFSVPYLIFVAYEITKNIAFLKLLLILIIKSPSLQFLYTEFDYIQNTGDFSKAIVTNTGNILDIIAQNDLNEIMFSLIQKMINIFKSQVDTRNKKMNAYITFRSSNRVPDDVSNKIRNYLGTKSLLVKNISNMKIALKSDKNISSDIINLLVDKIMQSSSENIKIKRLNRFYNILIGIDTDIKTNSKSVSIKSPFEQTVYHYES